MPPVTKKRYVKRLEKLRSKQHADGWWAHWREIADFIAPRRFVYSTRTKQTSRGKKKHRNIINNTAARSNRTLSSGLQAGASSPASRWFRFTTNIPDLNSDPAVQRWLSEVEDRLFNVMARSNVYDGLAEVYTDLPTFGQSPIRIDEDDETVVRAEVLTCGTYFIAQDRKKRIQTVYRETTMTVEQIVEKFAEIGADGKPWVVDNPKFSKNLQEMWARDNFDGTINVIHLVERHLKRDPARADRHGKPWLSVWWEDGASVTDKGHGAAADEILGWSGFNEFPYMVPRWSKSGDDEYGTSIAMDSLGDTRTLQTLERDRMQMTAKLARPAMGAPAGLARQAKSQNPGSITYIPTSASGQKFEPLYIPDAKALQAVRDDIRDVESRIGNTWLTDLFLLLARRAAGGQPPTAREVDEVHEEKVLQLGPALERVHNELLKPLIDRIYAVMLRKGLLPEPPIAQMGGVELRVEFISVLAEAQKLVRTVALERLVAFIINLATVDPSAPMSIDTQGMIAKYADFLGIPPGVLRSKDQIQAEMNRLQAAQDAEQAKTEAEAARAGAQAASAVNLTDPAALTALLGQSGVPQGSPSVVAA